MYPSDLAANWRQAIATLGQSIRVEGPSPSIVETETVVDVEALERGLVHDLDWIEPRQSADALYELTSALPLEVNGAIWVVEYLLESTKGQLRHLMRLQLESP